MNSERGLSRAQGNRVVVGAGRMLQKPRTTEGSLRSRHVFDGESVDQRIKRTRNRTMNSRISSKLGALALGLALVGWTTMEAKADPIQYSTVGSVGTPPGGLANLVYFNGISNGTVLPPSSIDLGQFVVSSASATTNQTFKNTPFQIVASVGGDSSEQIVGVLNGVVGPATSTPSLAATITAINQYGNSSLPFNLNLPLNTPLPIGVGNGTSAASTSLSGVAAPVPEPNTIAMFTVILGGLAAWRRRRAAR